MKIAFASKDNIYVNQHFGWCEKFFIYEIDATKSYFINEIDTSLKQDSEIDKLNYKISCLDDSDIVYVLQLGPKASAMVKSAGIYPMQSSGDTQTIKEVIKALQNMMSTQTPLWLKRVMMRGKK
ncbi:MAG TPA: dinitrogenase iron-molybdenum cofactor biosynthesis protein [Campylobacterales bacterium]|nr:dinitrogenase iron-molybdenum cofactor biosynthesis protein [Campylobacterales bacterium]HHD80861.1 dinitrogenase iron-molybdenum cofactor biosynthesis protein [Campylobacterales bacterium]HHH51089.1 dinitrogenase iron-molybdenum cofactor biosynthesis protein [Campylobacterales bacterium]